MEYGRSLTAEGDLECIRKVKLEMSLEERFTIFETNIQPKKTISTRLCNTGKDEISDRTDLNNGESCPKWNSDVNSIVNFVDTEEESLVMSTIWIKIEAFDPACGYQKADEDSLRIAYTIEKQESQRNNAKDEQSCARPANIEESSTISTTRGQRRRNLSTVTVTESDHFTTDSKSDVMTTTKPSGTTTEDFKGKDSTTKETTETPYKEEDDSCKNSEDYVGELVNIAFKGPTVPLKRWRQYNIKVTIENKATGIRIDTMVKHDTFRWNCPDSCRTIGQEQFCDGIPHCPRGMDETKENCEVSQLPQKTAYSFYAYMLLLISFYWVFLSQKKPNLEHISMSSQRMSFDATFYKNNHLAQDTVDHLAEVKRLTFDKLFDVEEESVKEVCEEVCLSLPFDLLE